MRVFVAGATGQLARALAEIGAARGHVIGRFGRPQLDLARPANVEKVVEAFAPDLLVNAAAYTAVDDAEADIELAYAVNREGPAALALATTSLGVPLIHISTDYVFDGEKGDPYRESDAANPLGVYGASKRAGEVRVREVDPNALILRTSWVYGPDGRNFVTTMVRLAAERDQVDVVGDRFGSPTAAADLASALLTIGEMKDRQGGLFHLAGRQSASWYDLAEGIMARLSESGRKTPTLRRIEAAAYEAAARRPRDSRLDCSAIAAFGIVLPGWRESLPKAVDAILARRTA